MAPGGGCSSPRDWRGASWTPCREQPAAGSTGAAANLTRAAGSGASVRGRHCRGLRPDGRWRRQLGGHPVALARLRKPNPGASASPPPARPGRRALAHGRRIDPPPKLAAAVAPGEMGAWCQCCPPSVASQTGTAAPPGLLVATAASWGDGKDSTVSRPEAPEDAELPSPSETLGSPSLTQSALPVWVGKVTATGLDQPPSADPIALRESERRSAVRWGWVGRTAWAPEAWDLTAEAPQLANIAAVACAPARRVKPIPTDSSANSSPFRAPPSPSQRLRCLRPLFRRRLSVKARKSCRGLADPVGQRPL